MIISPMRFDVLRDVISLTVYVFKTRIRTNIGPNEEKQFFLFS